MIEAEVWARVLELCEPYERPTFEAVRRQPLPALERFHASGWQWARTPAGGWEPIDWIERLALRAVVHHDPVVRRLAYRSDNYLAHLVAAVVGAPSQERELAALLKSRSGAPLLPLWLDPLLGVMDAMTDLVYETESIDARDWTRAVNLLLSDDGLPAIVTRLHQDAKLISVNSLARSYWANEWGLAVVRFLSMVDAFYPRAIAFEHSGYLRLLWLLYTTFARHTRNDQLALFIVLETIVRAVEYGADLNGATNEGVACRTGSFDMLPLVDDAHRVVETLVSDLMRPILADLAFGLLTGFLCAGSASTRDMVARRHIERRLNAVIDSAMRPVSGLAPEQIERFLVNALVFVQTLFVQVGDSIYGAIEEGFHVLLAHMCTDIDLVADRRTLVRALYDVLAGIGNACVREAPICDAIRLELHTAAPKIDDVPEHETTRMLAVFWSDLIDTVDRAHLRHHQCCVYCEKWAARKSCPDCAERFCDQACFRAGYRDHKRVCGIAPA